MIKTKNKEKGFSLIEIIVVVSIMAVMTAVLVPSLIGYVERGRASRDSSAMSEVKNAIQIALTDQDTYDELLRYVVVGNMASYSDAPVNPSDYMITKGDGANVLQYKTSDKTRTADEVVYSFDGNMEGVTITFQPAISKESNETVYYMKDGIINKGLQNTNNSSAANNKNTSLVQSGRTGESTEYPFGEIDYLKYGTIESLPNLSGKLRSIVGETVNATSQTYRNSDYTVFIKMNAPQWDDLGTEEDNAIEVYGQYNGTNLSAENVQAGAAPTPPTDPSKPVEPGGGTGESGGGSGGSETPVVPPKPSVIKVPKPSIEKQEFVYNGQEHTIVLKNYDSKHWTLKGDQTATNAGAYTVTCTPNTGVVWNDGTEAGNKSEVTLHWTILPKTISLDWDNNTRYTYSGEKFQAKCTANGVIDGERLDISLKGSPFGPLPGKYVVEASIENNENYVLSNSTQKTKEYQIVPLKVQKPVISDTNLIYDKTEKSPTITGYNINHWDITGTKKATNAGTYRITFKPKAGIVWYDDKTQESTDAFELQWTIKKKSVELSWSEPNSFKYDNQPHKISCSVTGVCDGDTVSAVLDKTEIGPNVGTYTVNASLTHQNYVLSSIATTSKDYSIVSQKITTIPTIDTTTHLVYNKTEQSPVLLNYDENVWSVSGETSGMDARQYNLRLTPRDGYVIDDGTEFGSSSPITLQWSIDKKPLLLNWTTKTPLYYNRGRYNATCEAVGVCDGDTVNVVISGNPFGPNVGTYDVEASIRDENYCLDANAQNKVQYAIVPKKVQQPVVAGSITYDKNEHQPTIVYSNGSKDDWTIVGTDVAIDAGMYEIELVPRPGIVWDNGTPEGSTESVKLTWEIKKKGLDLVWTTQQEPMVYNGQQYSASCSVVRVITGDTVDVLLSGSPFGPDAGTYEVTASIRDPNGKNNYELNKDTEATKTYTIEKQTIAKPSINSAVKLTYNKQVQAPTIINYDATTMSLSGEQNAINAGTYTVTVTPQGNFVWEDGTRDAVELQWTINKKPLTLTWTDNTTTIPYNGNKHSINCTPVGVCDGDIVNIVLDGNPFGPNAGTYTVTASLSNENYEIKTSEIVQKDYTIENKTIKIPYLDTTQIKTYNRQQQSAPIINYDPNTMTIGGIYTEVNAGKYTFTIKPKENYYWEDGTKKEIQFNWEINKKEITNYSIIGEKQPYDGNKKSVSIKLNENSGVCSGDVVNIIVSGNGLFGPNVGSYELTFEIDNQNYYTKSNKILVSIYMNTTLRTQDTWFTFINENEQNTILKDSINNIIIVKTLPKPKEQFAKWWDASDGWNKSVIAAYDNNGTLYISSEGKEKINTSYDSTKAFADFTQVSSFDASMLNTSYTVKMGKMFYSFGKNVTTSFAINGLSNWNVSNVTDMSYMFVLAGYSSTTWSIGGLSHWNVSNVTNMYSMFSSAGYSSTTWSIGDLSHWNVSNVTNMSSMFSRAGYSSTTWSIGDLSHWNVSKVTDMSYMFSWAGYIATTWDIGSLNSWNVGKVANMASMFIYAGYNATTWNIGDLSHWNVSNVTNMHSMFSSAGYSSTTWSIGDLSHWNVSKVTDMHNMFQYSGYNSTTWNVGTLSGWKTNNVTDMSYMFFFAGRNAQSVYIDLSNWDTSKVTNMSSMFGWCGEMASTVFVGNLSNWNVSKVTNMSSMFGSIGVQNATSINIGNIGGWDVSNVTDMRHMFANIVLNKGTSIYIGDLSKWNTENVTNMDWMFNSSAFKKAKVSQDLSSWNVSKVATHKSFKPILYLKIKEPKWNY